MGERKGFYYVSCVKLNGAKSLMDFFRSIQGAKDYISAHMPKGTFQGQDIIKYEIEIDGRIIETIEVK